MVFECIVKNGHRGAGRYVERKIYIHANNILEAFYIVKNKSGVKKGKSYKYGQGILKIKRIN